MAEDFNHMRMLAKKIVETEYRQAWQFAIEIDGAPEDFDFYVKDISYGPFEIETEQEKVGMATFTYPTGTQPVTVSMTMRDNMDGRIYSWFEGCVLKMVNPDGTVNLPDAYIQKWRRLPIDANNKTYGKPMELDVIPTQLGDVSESREDANSLEFPITLVQFRS